MERISITKNIDCMDFMRELPDGFFDLIIADPPYGIGQGGKKQNSKSFLKDGSRIVKFDRRNGRQIIVIPKKYSTKYTDKKSPDKSFFDECIRVSKNQIFWMLWSSLMQWYCRKQKSPDGSLPYTVSNRCPLSPGCQCGGMSFQTQII